MTVEEQLQPGSFTRLLLCVLLLTYLSVVIFWQPAYVPFGLTLLAGGVYLTYREYRFYRERSDR